MKHFLKVIIAALILSAVGFMVIDLQSSSEQAGLILPAAVLSILAGIALIEVDRRLVALESDKATSDKATSDEG